MGRVAIPLGSRPANTHPMTTAASGMAPEDEGVDCPEDQDAASQART